MRNAEWKAPECSCETKPNCPDGMGRAGTLTLPCETKPTSGRGAVRASVETQHLASGPAEPVTQASTATQAPRRAKQSQCRVIGERLGQGTRGPVGQAQPYHWCAKQTPPALPGRWWAQPALQDRRGATTRWSVSNKAKLGRNEQSGERQICVWPVVRNEANLLEV